MAVFAVTHHQRLDDYAVVQTLEDTDIGIGQSIVLAGLGHSLNGTHTVYAINPYYFEGVDVEGDLIFDYNVYIGNQVIFYDVGDDLERSAAIPNGTLTWTQTCQWIVAADVLAWLGISVATANDTILTADSSTATGLKWASPAASGGMTLISNTVANANSSIQFNTLGSYKQLLLIWHGLVASGNGQFGMRFNNDSNTKYYIQTGLIQGSACVADLRSATHIDATYGIFGQSFTSTDRQKASTGYLLIDNYTSTSLDKFFEGKSGWRDVQFGSDQVISYQGSFDDTTAITSLDIVRLSGTATLSNSADTSIRLYGIS